MINQFMINLQDSSSPMMEQLSFFHDHSLFFLLFILSVVTYIMMFLFFSKSVNKSLLFNEEAEIFWTLFPGLILVLIALPSLKILYMSDEVVDPEITIKVIGQQWYWTYEYSDYHNINFQSYMLKETKNSDFRLLEVDNHMIIPVDLKIRMIVTSIDVIHSWTVPSMGVKIDANPGRLNQCLLQGNRMGLFYGQCSEICGALHSFMPICVEVVNMDSFLKFLFMN